ncbi:MAG: exodeoxyribonuclease VII large subunit [Ignavibacteriales bacterium]|nr:exodeoxyribonuclease VII large subunit [Ignavibacteriales bacterium]MCF8304792.1 exodeoxyribonuclease VII large subunit [Ignavibacteriales bacterium]MCF8314481.1 exodeoxyribonuclease VII large subunit [Ignavibacteriales bacterium]MCF8436482.1 exodeoxyribonuclease VII large subunit [Ignavibacteriales bacterium]
MIEQNDILTVAEVANLIKARLEENFYGISVIGEISNFTAHISGHWYFTIKDNDAQLSCTMWKSFNTRIRKPANGDKVVLSGKVTMYVPRGTLQIDVRDLKPAGLGDLQIAFEKLKKKLSDEGLFDARFKKAIKKLPVRIGVVTAAGGAALRDMINVARRRFPLVEIVLTHAKVQGDGAAEEIVSSIEELNKLDNIDTIIVGRGGGSLEDLWAFNEEIVARAIFASRIPVVTGIGHEIDFTIADFVSDLRAPTPSAAMELSTPNQNDIINYISDFCNKNEKRVQERISLLHQKIDRQINSYSFRKPEGMINDKYQKLDNTFLRIQNFIDNRLNESGAKLNLLTSALENLDHRNVLKRGFTITRQDNKYIARSSQLNTGKSLEIIFYDGTTFIEKE